jgi:hypothetical protein
MLDLLFLTSAVSAYGLCSRTAHRFSANLPTVPIQATATRSITREGQVIPVTVSGSIRVIDGCSFAMEGVTISGPTSFAIFGGTSESDNASVRLVTEDTSLANRTSPWNATYTFIQTAGNWVNFNDFTQFNLFDPTTNVVFGQARLPGQVSQTATATGTAPGTRTTAPPAGVSTSAIPSPSVTSGVEHTTIGAIGITSLLLSLL